MPLHSRFFHLALALLLGVPSACASTAKARSAPAAAPHHRRAIILSCDGGGAQLFTRMLKAGRMPHLAALRARGLAAEYARTSFPSKTAPGHASIWTGTYGDHNGITANHLPLEPFTEHDLTESSDGFDATSLKSDPIWVTAAKQGKRAIVVQGTHSTPVSAYQPGGKFGSVSDRVRIIDFYKGQIGPHVVYGSEVPRRPGDWVGAPKGSLAIDLPGPSDMGAMPALLADDPADPTLGFDTVAIGGDRRWQQAVKLKAGPGGRSSAALPWPHSQGRSSFFRLFELSPDATRLRLFRTAIGKQTSNQTDIPTAALGNVAGGPETQYGQNQFGPTVLTGGDGTAETRYVETVGLCIDNRLAVAQTLMTRDDWDLTCVYLPFPDAAAHMWTGLLDPASPTYRPGQAAVLDEALAQVCGKVDSFIGNLAAVDPEAVLAVTSDHGMEAVHWNFYPNVLLERAGLLAHRPDGTLDLSRTRICYPVFEGASLSINRVGRKGGIVTEREIPDLLERTRKALMAAKDPRTGKPVVTALWAPDPELGNGGPMGGDLYMDLLPGYYFHAKLDSPSWWAPRHPFMTGGHVFHPDRPAMRAMFTLAGPGIPSRLLPPVRTIDVTPTVCAYLGIRPPDGATGRSLLPMAP